MHLYCLVVQSDQDLSEKRTAKCRHVMKHRKWKKIDLKQR